MDTADTAKPAPPELKEIASVERDWTFPIYMGVLINRDDTLLQRGGGKGLKIYDDIERDAHAYSVLQKRKLAVIARPWEVKAASDKPLDVQASEIVKAQLAALNFDQVTLDLLDALLKGFSVGEVMWRIDGAQLVADRMIVRDQRRFIFDSKYALHMLTRENLVTGELMPERKFIVHSFGAKDASPYGFGLGNKLFWPVFFKRQDITFWMIFADKFGSPTAVGKYPPGASPDDQKKLLAALAAIAQDAGIIVPEGMVVELLEAARAGAIDTYEKLAKYMDDQMSECVLGETMTTSSRGSGLGQGGQAQVHNEVRLELVKADADLLSGTLNRTLVRWISEYNVPGATPPAVWRIVEEAKDLNAQATRDVNICNMGFRPTLDYIKETYGDGWEPAPAPPTGNIRALAAPGQGAGGAGGAGGLDPVGFAETVAAILSGQAAIDRAGAAPSDAALQAQAERVLAPVLELVKGGADYAEIMAKLVEVFPAMDAAGLEELLARAIFVGDLWGRAGAAADGG